MVSTTTLLCAIMSQCVKASMAEGHPKCKHLISISLLRESETKRAKVLSQVIQRITKRRMHYAAAMMFFRNLERLSAFTPGAKIPPINFC
jgi:hypothetical protein